jgi:coniferyl-aldehyde dehydrogenase
VRFDARHAGSKEIADMAINLDEYFAEMRNAAAREPYPSLERRDCWLAAIEGILSNHSDDFCTTIAADFGWRSPHETRVLEILSSLEAVRFARKHLRDWMAPETREASRWFLTSSARVQYQPLGVVGIIVPWNYPLYLAVAPLVAALAAGNRVMLKPSEFSAQTGQLLQQLLADNFPQGEVRVVPGDVEVGSAFAQLPFDHLLFTGSTEVARDVLGRVVS